VLAFGAVLHALDPAGLSDVFSVARLALHGVVCFALGTAISWASASRALADLDASFAQRGEAERRPSDLDRVASEALECAHRSAGRFAAGSFAVWMLCASLGILFEPQLAAQSHVVDRLVAYAALGLLSAALNTMLVARVIAPVADALALRVPLESRAQIARPLPLAWTLRLLVTALVLVPAVLGSLAGAPGRAGSSGLATALGSPVAVSLLALAIGLVLAELVSSQVRSSAAALRDAARRAAQGSEDQVAGSGEFSEVYEAIASLSHALRTALDSFAAAGGNLGAGISELGATREAVVALTDAQVADVQRLTQSMSSVYSHSERISESIQDLRIAVDESSSSVTELGAAGEQLVGTARELTSRADTVSTSIQRALSTLGDVARSTDVLAAEKVGELVEEFGSRG
jgi:methyl-accepting chemotaxis protein